VLRLASLCVVVLCCGPARAEGLSAGADRELAERNFRIGSERYEETDYRAALDHFERARAAYPSSALDYNVARCLDRLDRPDEAIVEYQRYLAKSPRGASADDVRERVRVLRERIRLLAAEQEARLRVARGEGPRPLYKRWWLWTSIAAAAATGVAIGLGVGLTRPSTPSASTDYGTVRFP